LPVFPSNSTVLPINSSSEPSSSPCVNNAKEEDWLIMSCYSARCLRSFNCLRKFALLNKWYIHLVMPLSGINITKQRRVKESCVCHMSYTNSRYLLGKWHQYNETTTRKRIMCMPNELHKLALLTRWMASMRPVCCRRSRRFFSLSH
jgi:hypothetical protein